MSTAQATRTAIAAELPRVAWHISTRSDANHASCVEAGPLRDGSGRVAVRHSHDPYGLAFVSTRAEWDTFLTGIKNGTYDMPG